MRPDISISAETIKRLRSAAEWPPIRGVCCTDEDMYRDAWFKARAAIKRLLAELELK